MQSILHVPFPESLFLRSFGVSQSRSPSLGITRQFADPPVQLASLAPFFIPSRVADEPFVAGRPAVAGLGDKAGPRLSPTVRFAACCRQDSASATEPWIRNMNECMTSEDPAGRVGRIRVGLCVCEQNNGCDRWAWARVCVVGSVVVRCTPPCCCLHPNFRLPLLEWSGIWRVVNMTPSDPAGGSGAEAPW